MYVILLRTNIDLLASRQLTLKLKYVNERINFIIMTNEKKKKDFIKNYLQLIQI